MPATLARSCFVRSDKEERRERQEKIMELRIIHHTNTFPGSDVWWWHGTWNRHYYWRVWRQSAGGLWVGECLHALSWLSFLLSCDVVEALSPV